MQKFWNVCTKLLLILFYPLILIFNLFVFGVFFLLVIIGSMFTSDEKK